MDKLYGLAVCGGLSTRMGTDKSLLIYHGQPQRYYVFNMLRTICGKAFISCNQTQAAGIRESFPKIIDSSKYKSIGPMASLLSAFEAYPEAAFLVCGCDYPFLHKTHLEALKNAADKDDMAVAYYNESHSFYEPLLALYKPECYENMQVFFAAGDYSLNHFLKDAGAKKIVPQSPGILKSIDTPAEYEYTMKQLRSQ